MLASRPSLFNRRGDSHDSLRSLNTRPSLSADPEVVVAQGKATTFPPLLLLPREKEAIRESYNRCFGVWKGTLTSFLQDIGLQAFMTESAEAEIKQILENLQENQPIPIELIFDVCEVLRRQHRDFSMVEDADTLQAYTGCGGGSHREGCVNADTIRGIFSDFQLTHDLEAILKVVDTDGSKKIEYEEFQTMLYAFSLDDPDAFLLEHAKRVELEALRALTAKCAKKEDEDRSEDALQDGADAQSILDFPKSEDSTSTPVWIRAQREHNEVMKRLHPTPLMQLLKQKPTTQVSGHGRCVNNFVPPGGGVHAVLDLPMPRPKLDYKASEITRKKQELATRVVEKLVTHQCHPTDVIRQLTSRLNALESSTEGVAAAANRLRVNRVNRPASAGVESFSAKSMPPRDPGLSSNTAKEAAGRGPKPTPLAPTANFFAKKKIMSWFEMAVKTAKTAEENFVGDKPKTTIVTSQNKSTASAEASHPSSEECITRPSPSFAPGSFRKDLLDPIPVLSSQIIGRELLRGSPGGGPLRRLSKNPTSVRRKSAARRPGRRSVVGVSEAKEAIMVVEDADLQNRKTRLLTVEEVKHWHQRGLRKL